MNEPVVNADPGDEHAEREPEPTPSSGLCSHCRLDASLPGLDLCGFCAEELYPKEAA